MVSVVSVVFNELPIYNWAYTISVAYVTSEIKNYMPLNPRKYWIKENDTSIPAKQGEIIILDHKSGSRKHTYHDIVAVLIVVENKSDSDKELGLAVKNAEIIAALSTARLNYRKTWDEMKLAGIEVTSSNLKWIQAKLYYLDKKTGFLAKMRRIATEIDYEGLYREILENIKTLPREYIQRLYDDIREILDADEAVEARMG